MKTMKSMTAVLLGMVIVMILTSGVANSQTICGNKNTGAMRVASSVCKSNETSLQTITLQGPQGLPGPKGDTGAIGPQGPSSVGDDGSALYINHSKPNTNSADCNPVVPTWHGPQVGGLDMAISCTGSCPEGSYIEAVDLNTNEKGTCAVFCSGSNIMPEYVDVLCVPPNILK